MSCLLHQTQCFDWWCTACDLRLPAEAKNRVRDREELCHTNTEMYEVPEPTACCEHRLSHRPEGTLCLRRLFPQTHSEAKLPQVEFVS